MRSVQSVREHRKMPTCLCEVVAAKAGNVLGRLFAHSHYGLSPYMERDVDVKIMLF